MDIISEESENFHEEMTPIAFVAVPPFSVKSEPIDDEQSVSCVSHSESKNPLHEDPLNCDMEVINVKEEMLVTTENIGGKESMQDVTLLDKVGCDYSKGSPAEGMNKDLEIKFESVCDFSKCDWKEVIPIDTSRYSETIDNNSDLLTLNKVSDSLKCGAEKISVINFKQGVNQGLDASNKKRLKLQETAVVLERTSTNYEMRMGINNSESLQELSRAVQDPKLKIRWPPEDDLNMDEAQSSSYEASTAKNKRKQGLNSQHERNKEKEAQRRLAANDRLSTYLSSQKQMSCAHEETETVDSNYERNRIKCLERTIEQLKAQLAARDEETANFKSLRDFIDSRVCDLEHRIIKKMENSLSSFKSDVAHHIKNATDENYQAIFDIQRKILDVDENLKSTSGVISAVVSNQSAHGTSEEMVQYGQIIMSKFAFVSLMSIESDHASWARALLWGSFQEEAKYMGVNPRGREKNIKFSNDWLNSAKSLYRNFLKNHPDNYSRDQIEGLITNLPEYLSQRAYNMGARKKRSVPQEMPEPSAALPAPKASLPNSTPKHRREYKRRGQKMKEQKQKLQRGQGGETEEQVEERQETGSLEQVGQQAQVENCQGQVHQEEDRMHATACDPFFWSID